MGSEATSQADAFSAKIGPTGYSILFKSCNGSGTVYSGTDINPVLNNKSYIGTKPLTIGLITDLSNVSMERLDRCGFR